MSVDYICVGANAMSLVNGPENQKGLKLELNYNGDGTALAETSVPKRFLGWPNVVHGGILATLLEEVMAYAASGGKNAEQALSLEQDVSFFAPMEPDARLSLSAKVVARQGAQVNTQAEARRKSDLTLVASAHGVYWLQGENA